MWVTHGLIKKSQCLDVMAHTVILIWLSRKRGLVGYKEHGIASVGREIAIYSSVVSPL